MEDRITDPVAWLAARGLHAVRGGAEIDGEHITAEELEEVRNRRKWRARQHEEDTRLKRDRDAIEQERASLREKERLLAAKEADLLEGRGKTPEPQAELPPLPNPVDDPEGYVRAAQAREDALRQQLTETRRVVDDLRNRTDSIGSEVDSKVNGSATFNRVVSANEQLLNRYAEQHGISGSDMSRVEKHLQAFRVDGEGYGEYVSTADGRRVWQYTPEAVEAADRIARWEHHQGQIEESAFQKGQTESARHQRADRPFQFGEGGVPAADAPLQDLASYYYNLPEKSPVAQRFIDALPVPTVKQLLEFNVEHLADLQGEADMGHPLGVEAVEARI